MAYEVPRSKKSLAQNRFEFTIEGSKKKYSIPLLKFLKPDLVLSLESMTQAIAMKTLLETEAPGILEVIEDMDQLENLFVAWGEASGVTMGESSASLES